MMLSKNFSRRELACRCGCNRIGSWPIRLKHMINCLEKLRSLTGGKPVVVTSGYRCPKHNAEVGGIENSYHTQCLAVDLYIPGKTLSEISLLAKEAGFPGRGKYPDRGIVHCDFGEKRTWIEYG